MKNGLWRHDISNRKALISYRGSEKKYQPRRGCLEVIERDCCILDVTLLALLTNIASTKYQGSLSSAIRLFVLNFYRDQLELQHRHNNIQTALRSHIQAVH